jgi:hypothetical protein
MGTVRAPLPGDRPPSTYDPRAVLATAARDRGLNRTSGPGDDIDGTTKTSSASANRPLIAVRGGWARIASWYVAYGRYIRRVGNVLLFAWFAWQTYARISFFLRLNFPWGIDATIYYRGVVAWLHGADPWAAAVTVNGYDYHYAGSPVTTVLMAPASLLGEQAFTWGWLALSLAATVWTLRRLHFPLWWLLFPPIAEALFSGNPQLVVLALLVANTPVASALATGLKVYAFIPLLGETRWRQIGIAVLFNAATILVAPNLWLDYLRELGAISSRLERESLQGLSAFYFPMLLAICIVALLLLALRDRRAAGWLTVPAIWPASQFHYSTMALPVMSPFLAVVLAYPYLRLPPVAIVLDIGRRLVTPLVMRVLVAPEHRGDPLDAESSSGTERQRES